ncbi:MAG: tetratricopeptide repeat protein, partial [Spirochaetales bacterium]
KEYLDRLPIARMDFDKAHIYGLGYIYAKTGVAFELKGDRKTLLGNFRKCVNELDWALFIDDTFIDPYILKGWVSQYVDLRRRDDLRETGGRNESLFARFFPRYLWESNIQMYEKALEINDERINPGKEGNLHLNIANTYFLLTNYPRALRHYENAARFKRSFNSRIEEALFYYHLGYCYWQDGRYGRAREEMIKTLDIYQTMASGRNVRRYRQQVLDLYRFFGLLARMENNHADAIAWFNKVLDFAAANRVKIDRARYLQEIAYCHRELGDTDTALSYLGMADSLLKRYSDDERKYYLRVKVLGLGPISLWNLGGDVAVIGENRIFTELDTQSKRLLNLSLQEEAYYGMGEYRASIRFLERKLEVLGKRSERVDNETRIRTVNNIGYCRFLLHEYGAARAAFARAWDLAADPKVDDLEGAFVAIINLANLYAYLAENVLNLREPVSEIDALIERISAFRNVYEQRRLASETARLEAGTKVLRRKPTGEEFQSLRMKVAEETAGVHYDVDVALSVLRFYKAELLSGIDTGGGADRLETARRAFGRE